MTLKTYLTEIIPDACGVNRAFGQLAYIAYLEELTGNEFFAQKNFKSIRERASIALPFYPVNKKAYNYHLDLCELLLLTHGQSRHGHNNQKRIDEILNSRIFTKEEMQMSVMEWWSG